MGKITRVITKQIGRDKQTFMVEGSDFHDVMLTSQKLSFGNVHKCGCCGSDALVLGAHETKEDNFVYAYVRCLECKSTLNFGQQKKNPDVVYLRTRDENGKKVLDWQKFESQA